jgi:ATP-dependent 26S proteasome regulatory subunit
MYEDLGIPYRRGYLLAGPPGTGKSSLIHAMASHFELPIYSVPLRGADMTGERLAALLANCRNPSLIALEDIDCLGSPPPVKSKTSDGLTIGDLLNVVDGIGASEDRVLFMIANHPEALNLALTRAGRVDRKFYLDYARDEQLRSFHNRIAQYHAVRPWLEFRSALPERATIADAQALALQEQGGAGLQTCHDAIPGGMCFLHEFECTREVGSKTDFAGRRPAPPNQNIGTHYPTHYWGPKFDRLPKRTHARTSLSQHGSTHA